MKIDNLNDFRALVRLAKREGIESMKVDGIEFYINPNLIAKPIKTRKTTNIQQSSIVNELIDTPDELSPEAMLFWSAKGQDT